MIIVEDKFQLNSIVYLKTDIEQKKRIVTGIIVRNALNDLQYELSCGTLSSWHREGEISVEKDELITMVN